MGTQQARQIGVDMTRLSPPPDRLFGAAGEELDCKGTFLCTLKLGKATASSVTVCIIPTITERSHSQLTKHSSDEAGIVATK